MALFSKLLAYWKIDETTAGATILDAHNDPGGPFDIAESNGGSPSSDVAGKIGRARRLIRGGTSNQYFPRADTGVNDEFRLSNNAGGFACNCWFNRGSNFASTEHTLIGKRDPGLNEYALAIRTATSQLVATIVNTGPTGFDAISTSTVPTGSGPFIMGTLNYNKVTKVIQVWFNGTLEGTNTLTGTEFVGAGDFAIGGDAIGLFHDGAIDEVAVFDDVLTPIEIMNLYNNGNGLPYPLVEPGGGGGGAGVAGARTQRVGQRRRRGVRAMTRR